MRLQEKQVWVTEIDEVQQYTTSVFNQYPRIPDNHQKHYLSRWKTHKRVTFQAPTVDDDSNEANWNQSTPELSTLLRTEVLTRTEQVQRRSRWNVYDLAT